MLANTSTPTSPRRKISPYSHPPPNRSKRGTEHNCFPPTGTNKSLSPRAMGKPSCKVGQHFDSSFFDDAVEKVHDGPEITPRGWRTFRPRQLTKRKRVGEREPCKEHGQLWRCFLINTRAKWNVCFNWVSIAPRAIGKEEGKKIILSTSEAWRQCPWGKKSKGLKGWAD